MGLRWFLFMLIASMGLVACGSDGDSSSDPDTSPTSVETEQSSGDEGADPTNEDGAGGDPTEGIDELVEGLEETQATQGGGGATLVVGESQWTFDSVLCAFGEEEIGQEGAELVVSSIQEGLQLYASIDSFGHSVSLDDIENFEEPSVSLSADRFNAELNGEPTEFIVVDAKTVTAEANFADGTAEAGTASVAGTFEATCP